MTAGRRAVPAGRRLAAASLAGAALLAGCGTDGPDYQSIWSTTTAPTTSEAPKQPLSLWLEDAGVGGVPMTPAILTEMDISIPTPPGWAPATEGKLPSAYLQIRTTPPEPQGVYTPQALLMVFKLDGDFDVAEAITHGYADAEISEQFTRVEASTDDYRGYPSAMIQGTYLDDDRKLQSFNRIVIPTAPSGQRYLVQLTVTTEVAQAAARGPAIDAIIAGFTVAPRR